MLTQQNTPNAETAAAEVRGLTYSNPRIDALIENWPWGRKQRTVARFWIETHPKRGQRACRALQHPIDGGFCATKCLTYADTVRIVDGSDGRTYIIELGRGGSVRVMCGDMKYQKEFAWNDRDGGPTQARALELIAVIQSKPAGETIDDDDDDNTMSLSEVEGVRR